MKIKRVWMVAVVLAYALGVGSVVSEGGVGVTQVTVWMPSHWAKQAPILEERFNKEHPGLRAKIELIPVNGYLEKVVIAVVGGNPPDVAALDVTMISSMVGRKLLMPWDQYIHGLDVDDFSKGAWSAGSYDGKIYALPYRSESSVYFYNKKMFDDVGLGYPREDWTYEDMLSFAKNITVPGQKWGVGLGASLSDQPQVMYSFAPVLWAFGGDFLDSDQSKVIINQANGVKAIQFWTDLYLKHKVAPEGSINYSITKDIVPMFGNNKVAMMPGSSSALLALKKYPDVKFDMQSYPGKVCRGGGESFAIPVGSVHPDEGRKFALWFVQPKILGELTIRTPARLSAFSTPPWNAPEYKKFTQASAYARLLPTTPSWDNIQTTIITELQNVMQGQKNAQQAADEIAKQGNEILRKK